MSIVKKAAVSAAAVSMAAGMLAFAPAASAENYAPQLPSNRVEAGSRQQLVIEGAQPNCRVTFSIRNVGGADNVNRGLVNRTRVPVNQAGEAASSLRMPTEPGRYLLITRVDNFPGQTGCTPTKSVQRITVR
jgi:hypothetical protein